MAKECLISNGFSNASLVARLLILRCAQDDIYYFMRKHIVCMLIMCILLILG